jgi:hypothetical protein
MSLAQRLLSKKLRGNQSLAFMCVDIIPEDQPVVECNCMKRGNHCEWDTDHNKATVQ